ncbi:Uncharacterised protein [Achromobacter sp. 2789STDY5608615]|nr:Uncharacterised protein [Achromobacter sp. 2789STDY5608615]
MPGPMMRASTGEASARSSRSVVSASVSSSGVEVMPSGAGGAGPSRPSSESTRSAIVVGSSRICMASRGSSGEASVSVENGSGTDSTR